MVEVVVEVGADDAGRLNPVNQYEQRGTQVIQIAAKVGARVIATAHTDQERTLVTGHGASDVVDYAQDVVAQVRTIVTDGVDAVVHLAGDAR